MMQEAHALSSSTDGVSQLIVGGVLVAMFVVLTLEKAHRVLVALGAVALLWVLTYLTPYHLISFEDSARALDLNVLLLLASMMAVVGVLKSTGVFAWAVDGLMRRAGNSPGRVVAMTIWFTAITSAFLDNVTTVIFVTPIAVGMAKQLKVNPIAILLPMVMASNIGGTATLIGDPPNIMIGSGAGLSFVDFMADLTAPILVMVLLLEWGSRRWFARDLVASPDAEMPHGHGGAEVVDPGLLRAMGWVCAFILIGFLTHGLTGMPAAVPATIGAGAALIVQDVLYLRRHRPTSEERVHGILHVIEHEIEWPTLVFFSFLFMVVGAAVETGMIARVAHALGDGIGAGRDAFGLSSDGTLVFAAILILWVSGFCSALIDNIPFVAVSIPIIHGLIPTLSGDTQVLWWALSMGACLGGNGTPIGASANVTTLDLAARRGTGISFAEFTRYGSSVVVMTLLVASLWLWCHIKLGTDRTLILSIAAFVAVGATRLLAGRIGTPARAAAG